MNDESPPFAKLAEALGEVFKTLQPIYKEASKSVEDAAHQGRENYDQRRKELEEEHRERIREINDNW